MSTRRPRQSRSGQKAASLPDHRGLVGQMVAGKYFVRRVVGMGGNGSVYEAEDSAMRRTVAMKVPGVGQNETIQKRFLREGRAGAAIAHPNVCALYDIGALPDGTPFIVMERMIGETLSDRLDREDKLPLSLALNLMVQVLSGLSAAHAGGIFHRDVKPSNIFIIQAPGYEVHAKIFDFGTSKLASAHFEDDELQDLTQTGFAVGTPFYMAPEQIRGVRDLDGRVDVFACGVILYEMLTGQRPFKGNSPKELFTRVVSADYLPIRHLEPTLPRAIDGVLERVLCPDRAARYQTADSFARALSALKMSTNTPLAWPPAPDLQADRLQHLRQRFHELAALHRAPRKDVPPVEATMPSAELGDMRPRTASQLLSATSVEIPIVFDPISETGMLPVPPSETGPLPKLNSDPPTGPATPPSDPVDSDPEGTELTQPRRRQPTEARRRRT
ncbi:MAG: serine/threonine-protein kinase [Polyangiaceae bacterium]